MTDTGKKFNEAPKFPHLKNENGRNNYNEWKVKAKSTLNDMDLLDIVVKPLPIAPKPHTEQKFMVWIEGRLVEAVMPRNKEDVEKFEVINKDWVKKNKHQLSFNISSKMKSK
jgi:hypothetical protein